MRTSETNPHNQSRQQAETQEHVPAAPWSGTALRGRDVLAVVILTVAFLVIASFLISDVPAVAVPALLLLESAVPVAVVQILLVRGRRISWREIGMRRAAGRWYVWASLTALLMLAGGINAVLQWLTGMPFRNPQIEFLAPAVFSWLGLVGMLLAAGIVAPIAEEVVFRGLFYGWLRQRMGVITSITLSAILFSLAHGIIVLIPVLTLQGAILAFFYERSGSLWPAVVLHGTFNATMVTLLYAALAAGVTLP